MVNWYYVHGTERVGPVAVETLRDLFTKDEINLDTYVWKKGFQNWERIKDVGELDLTAPKVETHVLTPERIVETKTEKKFENKVERKLEKKLERKEDKAKSQEEIKPIEEEHVESEVSPEISFNFDWKKVHTEDEVFFIKIGHDRKNISGDNLFGPYSLNELHDALEEKRINFQTLIYSAGMPGWIQVGDTPLNLKNLTLLTNHIIDEIPLIFVVKSETLPLIALVQKAGIKKITLLGAGGFEPGSVTLGSIYSGTTLKAKNIKMKIEEYNPREQKVVCDVIEMNDQARKIMLNYVN